MFLHILYVGLILLSILLIISVFYQNPKDQGGHSMMNMQKLVGAAEMPNLLQKITRWMTAALFVGALTFTLTLKSKRKERQKEAEVTTEEREED